MKVRTWQRPCIEVPVLGGLSRIFTTTCPSNGHDPKHLAQEYRTSALAALISATGVCASSSAWRMTVGVGVSGSVRGDHARRSGRSFPPECARCRSVSSGWTQSSCAGTGNGQRGEQDDQVRFDGLTGVVDLGLEASLGVSWVGEDPGV